MFLQLDPTIIQKRNILFMNYHLSDEDSILHVIPGEEKEIIKTGLSRIEDYAVYKGLDRVDKKTDDYNIYAKIYIRADNKKVEITGKNFHLETVLTDIIDRESGNSYENYKMNHHGLLPCIKVLN